MSGVGLGLAAGLALIAGGYLGLRDPSLDSGASYEQLDATHDWADMEWSCLGWRDPDAPGELLSWPSVTSSTAQWTRLSADGPPLLDELETTMEEAAGDSDALASFVFDDPGRSGVGLVVTADELVLVQTACGGVGPGDLDRQLIDLIEAGGISALADHLTTPAKWLVIRLTITDTVRIELATPHAWRSWPGELGLCGREATFCAPVTSPTAVLELPRNGSTRTLWIGDQGTIDIRPIGTYSLVPDVWIYRATVTDAAAASATHPFQVVALATPDHPLVEVVPAP